QLRLRLPRRADAEGPAPRPRDRRRRRPRHRARRRGRRAVGGGQRAAPGGRRPDRDPPHHGRPDARRRGGVMRDGMPTPGPLRPNQPVEGTGVTEIRGPYYSSFGPEYLDDLLSVLARFVDWVKLPGPAVLLLDDDAIARFVEVCRKHDVKVSA